MQLWRAVVNLLKPLQAFVLQQHVSDKILQRGTCLQGLLLGPCSQACQGLVHTR